MLERLGVEVDWMQLPPSIWLQSTPLLRFQEMVHSLKVVNDCAERERERERERELLKMSQSS